MTTQQIHAAAHKRPLTEADQLVLQIEGLMRKTTRIRAESCLETSALMTVLRVALVEARELAKQCEPLADEPVTVEKDPHPSGYPYGYPFSGYFGGG